MLNPDQSQQILIDSDESMAMLMKISNPYTFLQILTTVSLTNVLTNPSNALQIRTHIRESSYILAHPQKSLHIPTIYTTHCQS